MKKQIKILLSLLIVFNSIVSFERITPLKPYAKEDQIELLLTENLTEVEGANYNELHPFFSAINVEFQRKNSNHLNRQISSHNTLGLIHQKIQKDLFLGFKPALLQIHINEISRQKSHRI